MLMGDHFAMEQQLLRRHAQAAAIHFGRQKGLSCRFWFMIDFSGRFRDYDIILSSP